MFTIVGVCFFYIGSNIHITCSNTANVAGTLDNADKIGFFTIITSLKFICKLFL